MDPTYCLYMILDAIREHNNPDSSDEVKEACCNDLGYNLEDLTHWIKTKGFVPNVKRALEFFNDSHKEEPQ